MGYRTKQKRTSGNTKKQPKGKRARAKAKLERQWGERPIATAGAGGGGAATASGTASSSSGTANALGRGKHPYRRLLTPTQPQQDHVLAKPIFEEQESAARHHQRDDGGELANWEDAGDEDDDDDDDDNSSRDDDKNDKDTISKVTSFLHRVAHKNRKQQQAIQLDAAHDDGNDHVVMQPNTDNMEDGASLEDEQSKDDDDIILRKRWSYPQNPYHQRYHHPGGFADAGRPKEEGLSEKDNQRQQQYMEQQRGPTIKFQVILDELARRIRLLNDDATQRAALDGTSSRWEMHVSNPLLLSPGCTNHDPSFAQSALGKWYSTARTILSAVHPPALVSQFCRAQQVHRPGATIDRNPSSSSTPSVSSNLTVRQALLAPLVAQYADLLWTCVDDNRHHRMATMRLVVMHMLQHVLHSRAIIHQHNQILALREQQYNNNNKKKAEKIDDSQSEEEIVEFRDQGYTRPSILVLLPTRSCCLDFVRTCLALMPRHNHNEHNDAMDDGYALNPTRDDDDDLSQMVTEPESWQRFQEEYGPPDEAELPKGDPMNQDNANDFERRRRQVLQRKGAEWLELFGDDANDDDDFKMGIALQHIRHYEKGNIKDKKSQSKTTTYKARLFTDFYKSDMILASPLGLKMTLDDPSKSADFLSSIEICWVSRADVLLMQNWDHVVGIMSKINQQPTESNDTDFSRVRPYMLAGNAAHWRQLIVTSAWLDPCMMSLFKRFAVSTSGEVRLRRRTGSADAAVAKVYVPVSQVFQRINVSSLTTAHQDRLRYFENQVLSRILSRKQKHTLVFIASYFDFVAIRNMLLKRECKDFVSVTEYSRVSEVSRGRARFIQGRKSIMLYTGRAYYFLRHSIRGTKHLVFVGLPEHAEFYAHHVNRLFHNDGNDVDGNDDNHDHQYTKNPKSLSSSSDLLFDSDTTQNPRSCLVLFTKYDAHALERVVGAEHCSHMINSDKGSFVVSSWE